MEHLEMHLLLRDLWPAVLGNLSYAELRSLVRVNKQFHKLCMDLSWKKRRAQCALDFEPCVWQLYSLLYFDFLPNGSIAGIYREYHGEDKPPEYMLRVWDVRFRHLRSIPDETWAQCFTIAVSQRDSLVYLGVPDCVKVVSPFEAKFTVVREIGQRRLGRINQVAFEQHTEEENLIVACVDRCAFLWFSRTDGSFLRKVSQVYSLCGFCCTATGLLVWALANGDGLRIFDPITRRACRVTVPEGVEYSSVPEADRDGALYFGGLQATLQIIQARINMLEEPALQPIPPDHQPCYSDSRPFVRLHPRPSYSLPWEDQEYPGMEGAILRVVCIRVRGDGALFISDGKGKVWAVPTRWMSPPPVVASLQQLQAEAQP